jgi:hypothetical protein
MYRVHLIMNEYTSSWASTPPHERVHLIMSEYTSSWTSTPHHERVHLIMSEYTSSWTSTPHRERVHLIMNEYTSSSASTSHHERVHLIMSEYTSSWAGFEFTTLVVICTDCISSYKLPYDLELSLSWVGEVGGELWCSRRVSSSWVTIVTRCDTLG